MKSRHSYAVQKLKYLNSAFKIFSAITPKDLTKDDYIKYSATYNETNQQFNRWRNVYGKLTKLPVSISFFMCYFDAYLNDYKSIAVFEDDIMFNATVSDINTAIFELTAADHQLLYLGYCHIQCEAARKKGRKLSNLLFKLHDRTRAVCNHALIWRRELLRKFMERDSVVYWTHTNDNTLDLWTQDQNISKVVTKYDFVSQDRDNMGSFNANGWTSKSAEKKFKTKCDFVN